MSEQTPHTPGPWHIAEIIGPRNINNAEGEPIALAASRVSAHRTATVGDPEAVANARLIASAPALLEALKAMVQEYGRGDLTAADRAAHEAIAQAEGRTTP